MTIEQLFFELIRVAIGTQDILTRPLSAKEWQQLYEIAIKQSLVGICFAGVQRLGKGETETSETLQNTWNLPEILYLQWMGMAAKIQQKNEQMNQYTKDVLAHFRKEGFACTCLKGQGIAQLYTLTGSAQVQSLAGLRQSGDVDVWVAGGRKKLYEHSMKMFGKLEGLTYHHIHYPMYDDPEVEVHVWPSFLTNPRLNKRFQKFCSQYVPTSDCQDTPSLAFNRVFILQHCYGHFCGHGVGMRQLLDYYFVLRTSYENDNGNEYWKKETMKWIKHLGMGRFAHATMWLMKEVFRLDDKYLLCEPSEKDGRFLIAEVMETGNMGHHDERVDKKQLQSAVGRYLHNLKRDLRVARIAPNYALWEPSWGIFQFAYRKYVKLKYKRQNIIAVFFLNTH